MIGIASPYIAILKARLSILFQYKAAAIAGVVTQIFWGILKIMILEAFYAQAKDVPPITLETAIAFVLISQSLLPLIPWSLDKEIEAQVRSGQVAIEMIRPIDIYWYWYTRAVAMRIIPTILRSLPFFLVIGVFFTLPMPFSIFSLIAFALSCVNALLLSSAITTLIIISLFWTIAGDGIERLMPHIALVLTGIAIPLPLFPDWMQLFIEFQPFRYIIDVPVRIYLGAIAGEKILIYLVLQLIWTAVLIAFGRLLINLAMKRFVIHGG